MTSRSGVSQRDMNLTSFDSARFNGGIKDPNDGLTYGVLVFRYRLPQR
jgi:hypothetical protein